MPHGPKSPTMLAMDASLVKATELAWRWHADQTRKGKSAPYMGHLLQVQGLVVEFGGGVEQAAAALLHDALEDAPTPSERAARERTMASSFDPLVLEIVLDCTDTTPEEAGSEKGPWRVRKERYIGQLESAASTSLLVAACDKRHNLADLIGDLRSEGLSTFTRFNAGPEQQRWYFETLERVFRDQVPERLAGDLAALIHELGEWVDRAREEA